MNREGHYSDQDKQMPPKGWLTVSNPQGISGVKLQMELDQSYLMEKAVSWDLVVFALTVLIEVIKGPIVTGKQIGRAHV